MKQFLMVLGLVCAALLSACSSGPSKSDQAAECKVCAAQKAVKTAVPDAPNMACGACLWKEMLKACPKCEEMGQPCCEKCAANMQCPGCKAAGKVCDACKVAKADCATCAVKQQTWSNMACESCANSAVPCAKCAELKAKLDTVKCTEHTAKG